MSGALCIFSIEASEKADWREMNCTEKYSDLEQCQQDIQRLENAWFASFCFILNAMIFVV